MLKDEQLAELEALGTTAVRAKLIQSPHLNRGAMVHGLKSGDLRRSDVEAWLEEKYAEERDAHNRMLRWVRIAAWTIIGSMSVGIAAKIIGWL
jgi:hypothetical protein